MAKTYGFYFDGKRYDTGHPHKQTASLLEILFKFGIKHRWVRER